MHELSVCLSILDQVRSLAAERNADRVQRIELRIGPLSGVEVELLRSAWPMASAGTIAAEADLQIDEADIVVRCETCHVETPAAANRLVCGECGDFRTTVISGDEMILQRVELESA